MHNTHDFVNVNRTNTATKEIVNSIYEINPYQSLPTSAFTEALFRMESADSELQDVCHLSLKVAINANPTDLYRSQQTKHNLDHAALCSHLLQLKGR